MKKFEKILDDFLEHVQSDLGIFGEIISQQELKYLLKEEYPDDFPMVSYEYTDESNFEVSIDESKFLNDETHGGDWIMFSNICVMRLEFEIDPNFHTYTVDIDAFEINENYRNSGYARKIIEVLEHVLKKHGYVMIKVIPYDNNARDFWEHLGYIDENGNDILYKKTWEEDM